MTNLAFDLKQQESPDEGAFLSVERSFKGLKWVGRGYNERLTLALAQRHTLPDLIARSLAARGVDLETAPSFLDPKLRDHLPDPKIFRDMEKATTRLVKAIGSHEKVAVYGDYDVDGGTSAALFIRFAQAVGLDLRLYVPDRQREGYGPNKDAMTTLAEEGITLVVTVDCGTTAHEPLAHAKSLGLDVIVIDHHTSEPQLPPAFAVVNPNRLDENSVHGNLAAVGVTYLFIISVNRALRDAGFYQAARPEPDLLIWLDLVALGTVCDVVKLTGLNRAFVAQGLKVMSQRRNAGIAALASVAGCAQILDTYAAGFLLGPRVNAGGRVGEAALGARLLSTDDAALAMQMAQQLNSLNDERRMIEQDVLREAESLQETYDPPIVFVVSENWHPGVIGIVASRLKERYHHPAVVVSLKGDIGKGSGRSIGNIDLGAAIIAARQKGLLLNGGGHKMAAGFTVHRDKIESLREFLEDRIGSLLDAEPMRPSLTLDGLISGPAAQVDFVKRLSALGPFGTGNAEPRFAFSECRLIRAAIVGDKHVSVIFLQGNVRLRGIAFRAMESELGQGLLSQGGRPCHLAGHLRIDEWQGEERVQLFIDDAAG